MSKAQREAQDYVQQTHQKIGKLKDHHAFLAGYRQALGDAIYHIKICDELCRQQVNGPATLPMLIAIIEALDQD